MYLFVVGMIENEIMNRLHTYMLLMEKYVGVALIFNNWLAENNCVSTNPSKLFWQLFIQYSRSFMSIRAFKSVTFLKI